ncbi:MAG: endonuclease/exonuclease/phosphatase family protein [Allorhizobium sp.]
MKNKNDTLASTMIASFRNRGNRPVPEVSVRLPGAHDLVVASYNVHKCIGTDGRFDPERTFAVIREIGPDVIALQEADMRFGEKVGLLDLPRLQMETGLVPVPIVGMPKSHGWRGNALLFREGMVRDVHQIALPGLEPRGALVAEIELADGTALRVIAAHLGLLRVSRQKQADFIVDVMHKHGERPTIFMGDFNEWRLGKKSALHKLSPVFGPLPPALPSFPSRMPMLSLDRILANREGLICDLKVHDSMLARRTSDHLPIKARVDTVRALSVDAIS